MSESSLSITTLASVSKPGDQSRSRVFCLTIACHPDARRIGERAVLTPLLVRQPVSLSRTETLFAHPGDPATRPLADPYLSRDPILMTAADPPHALALHDLPERALVGGAPAGSVCKLSASDIGRGVLLQLSSRVLLLLHASAAKSPTPVEGLLGQSDAIDGLRSRLVGMAPLDTPVLIRGESGVGKERVAHALHALGKRAGKPFVAVNMATLGESTAAAVLFGYAKGAFTGASASHRGLFERAHRGTLFLDEIGDTPQSVQPMLLRALETGSIQPLGEEQERTVDVRVVAATDRDLEQDGAPTALRVALKHRLAGYELHVPPLRERPDDIPVLFVHFLREELRAIGREALLDTGGDCPQPPLRASFMSRLLQHRLPGNARELRHIARRLAIDALERHDLELTEEAESVLFGKGRDPQDALARPIDETRSDAQPGRLDERELLGALERHDFSPQRAAADLGVPPSTVHFWMRRTGIPRASDLDDATLRQAHSACGGDLTAMARQLRVSQRALRLALRRLGLQGPE